MADIQVIGNLGSDPDLSFTPSGKACLKFSIGDTPRRLNKDTNQWEDAGETTWWNVTSWERDAETLAEALQKGTRVLVTGTAGVRTYDRKDGSKGFSADIKPRTVAIIPRAAKSPVSTFVPPPQNGGEDPWAQTLPTDAEPPF